MLQEVQVLDKKHELGRIVIASFSSLDDARLFVQAKGEVEENRFEIFSGRLKFSSVD